MIIFRKKEFATVSTMQNRTPNKADICASSLRGKDAPSFRGPQMTDEEWSITEAVFKGGSKYNAKKATPVNRLKNGSLEFNIRHGDVLVDEVGRKTAESHISTKDTSFRDAYRDFLRNEKKLFEGDGVDPAKYRYVSSGDYRKLSNEDLKKEIRKLAKKEGRKKWIKDHKGILIGTGIGTAAIGTGAYLIHRHRKKKKESEKETKK